MTFHTAPLRFVAEMYLNDNWTDITRYVRYADGLNIQRGRQREGVALPDPSSCGMVLNNPDGIFSQRNPLSPYYGSLQQNTPFRTALILDTLTFGTTVSNAWPATASGSTWTTASVGGTISASDYSSASGVGRHSVPAANASRATYLNGVDFENVDVAVTWQLPFSTVTGGDIAAVVQLRGQSPSEFLDLRAIAKTNGTVEVEIYDSTGSLIDGPVSVAPFTGQRIRMRVQAEDQTLRLKCWSVDTEGEPYYWNLHTHDESLNVAGFVGLQTVVGTGSSNTKPIVMAWDDLEIRSPRLTAEIPAWPRRWDLSGRDAKIELTADGILRRLLAASEPTESAIRRGILATPNLVAYWPCEDQRNATSIASALPNQPVMGFTGPPDFASYSGLVTSAALPTLNNNRWLGLIPSYTDTGEVSQSYVLHIAAGAAPDGAIISQLYMSGTAKVFEVVWYSVGNFGFRIFDVADNILHNYVPVSPAEYATEDANLAVTVNVYQDGADVIASMDIAFIDEESSGEPFWLLSHVGDAVNLVGATCGVAKDIRFGVGNVMDNVAIGHAALFTGDGIFGLIDRYATGYRGERAGQRIRRLLEEQGQTVNYIGRLNDTPPMGPQTVATLSNLLAECVETDFGSLYESRFEHGLVYRTRASMYNQAGVELEFGKLTNPFEPTDDDDTTYNDITVNNSGASSYRVVKETGPLNVENPPDGIGRYKTSYPVNALTDAQLPDLAGWLLNLATVDQERYPSLSWNMLNPLISRDPVLARRLLDVNIDDRLIITAGSDRQIFDPITQLVRGYRERLSKTEHTFTVITSPETPYQVEILDDDEFKLDSDASSLENAINSSQTTFTVKVDDTTLWTEDDAEFPFSVMVGGEEMTVTDITTVTPSFIATGTAAHADNASVTPGVPGGSTTTGDLLLILAGTRDLNSSPTYGGTEYQLLLDAVSLRIWGKIHDGTESAPTIGVSGGAAGVTVSAQMCSFRNVPLVNRGSTVQGNSVSAQNIALPGLYALMAKSVAIYAGWKPDDWTSVATLAGATEIGEPSSTLGSDQGIVWDYRPYTGAVASPSDTFVVTGGTSQFSRSGVLVMGNWQTFTVVRSVNGVAKQHAAGTEVHVTKPARLGL